MAEARESPSQQESVTEQNDLPMEILNRLMLLLRETDTEARLDRLNALLAASTNTAINLRGILSYVQMVLDHTLDQFNADVHSCMQQKAAIEALETKIEEKDQKLKDLELEITSLELGNENGELFQVVDCLADLINEAAQSGVSMQKSVYFYTGPYGSDSFKLQIFYRMVSCDRGLRLQFGVYVKAGPRDQCPFSKKMSIRIYGIEDGKLADSIGVKFTPPVALYPQLYPYGTGPFWIEQFLYLSKIQEVIKDNSFVLSVKVES